MGNQIDVVFCVQIPMQIVARRPGDAAEVYAKT
jgi:UDP-glucose 4-epimerase